MRSLKFTYLQLLTAFLFILIFSAGFAQEYNISGVAKDSMQNPLPSATVYIQSVEDENVIDYTITGDDGQFELKGKTFHTDLDFFISFTGFQDHYQKIDLEEEETYDLGEVLMSEESSTLDEVLITGKAPPVRIKKDTLEFSADSYKTKENANLEDLLKKLPGVTVENDGSIKVNGKDVSKIKVNGKEFFGDDPKIATKNLPKELLEKIQVVDSKSKSDEFTGKESDSEDKTINVTIKEENNKGVFARLTAGAGTDHRYSLNGIGNYFKEDLRVSALASSNNVNSIGFSFDEIYDAMGRNAYSVMNSTGNSGITKSNAAGLDLVNSWDDKAELALDYFYNRASTETGTKVERENILPNRRYFTESESTSKNVNNNHRANTEFEYMPDTLTRISFRPDLTVNDGFSDNESYTESLNEEGERLNSSETERHSSVEGVNFSNRVDLTRKFGTKGGYFNVGFKNTNDENKEQRSNYTSRETYDGQGNLMENDIQDQFITDDSRTDEYAVDAGLRLPLTEKWKLDIDYTFTNGNKRSERLLYDADDISGNYDVLNDDLSSDFETKTYQHNPNAGIVYVSDKMNAGISGGLESTQLKNEEKFTNSKIDNTYNNMFARFYMRYKIDDMKSIFLMYRNSHSIPSITQLQPVANTTDPLNIVEGNPDLKPALDNRFRIGFHNYNFKTHYGIFVFAGGTYSDNKVVSNTLTDEDLVRTTTYANVDGQYDFNVGVHGFKEFQFKNESTLKPSIGARSSIRKDIGYSEGEKYHSNTYSIGPRAGIEFDIPDVLTVEPSYTATINNTKYSLNNQRNQNYTDHDLRLEVTTYLPKNFIFGNDITYTKLGQVGPGFKSNYVLWNMSLGYELWDGDGTIRAKVFDLLNQNVSTRRSTGEDYIQDTQELVLKRYMMFSFTYKLSKFGGKKMRNDGRGGGPRRRG